MYLCPWSINPEPCTPIIFDSKGNRAGGRRVEGNREAGHVHSSTPPRAVAPPWHPHHTTLWVQPSLKRAGMIQKHVALISPESPTTLGGQASHTKTGRVTQTMQFI